MENHIGNKTWKFIVLALLAMTAILSLGVYLYQEGNYNVTLEVDEKVADITSRANTVEVLLLNEGITLKKGAYINVSLDTELEDNMNIIINNPKSYIISVGNDELDIQSTHTTVKEILKDNGITLDGKDYTSPALDEEIAQGSKIELYNVEEVVETLEEPIPFERVVMKNKNLDIGSEKLVQKGKDGLKKSYISKEYVNGELVETTIVKEEILEEPVSNVVEKGTKSIVVTSRGNTDYKKVLTMTATAYDLSFESCGKKPGDKYYGITASGTKARPGVVAVDPKVIPLGTKLYIESLDGSTDYGFAVAEDTGGAIKGNKIDLFFQSSTDVYNFGRKKVKVYILN